MNRREVFTTDLSLRDWAFQGWGGLLQENNVSQVAHQVLVDRHLFRMCDPVARGCETEHSLDYQ
jgi:agmatine/peptidylarginine deiminase